MVVWFTGLPASGKTTLAHHVRDRLAPRACVVLDSDEVRRALGDETYAAGDRDAFYRALGGLAALLAHQGHVVLVPATAPRRAHREQARARAPRYVEVWVRTPLAACEARDPKGLYARARAGAAPTLPGLGVPYEVPAQPEVIAEGGEDRQAIARIVERIVELVARGVQPARDMSATTQPATESDLARVLGEVDPLTVARILEIGPSVDELDEAVRAAEDEQGFGELPRTPSSARVANVRAVLAELAELEADDEPAYAPPA